MPVVRISDGLYKEVQKWAVPLKDNFDKALRRIIDAANKYKEATKTEVAAEPIDMKELEKALAPSRRAYLTPPKKIRLLTLQSLAELGGEAPAQDVISHVGQKLKGQLKKGDIELNSDGIMKWKKAVHFARLALVRERLLANKKNTSRGIWRITPEGLEYLKQETGHITATDADSATRVTPAPSTQNDI